MSACVKLKYINTALLRCKCMSMCLELKNNGMHCFIYSQHANTLMKVDVIFLILHRCKGKLMKSVLIDGVSFLPSKVVCIGRNYVEHIKELENETPTEPVVFIKPNSSISNNVHSGESQEIHYEGEICFSIKNNNIYGIGFGLDLTKRNIQATLKSKGLPWERAKSFDKSAVFSEFVKCSDDIQHYKMELFINNQLKQFATYGLMIYKPEALVKEIQSFITLEDNDVIMSGTPKGVGIINLGDKFTAKIYHHDIVIIEKSWIAQ